MEALTGFLEQSRIKKWKCCATTFLRVTMKLRADLKARDQSSTPKRAGGKRMQIGSASMQREKSKDCNLGIVITIQ